MKKFLIIVLFIVLGGFFLVQEVKDKVKSDLAQPVQSPEATNAPTRIVDKNGRTERSLFVPYWALEENLTDVDTYGQLIYFGAAPTAEGIDMGEAGAVRIADFMNSASADKEKLLAIRMINSDMNFAILKDNAAQERVISDALSLAQEHGFSGILLDLELSAIPFDSLVKQINEFNKRFYGQAKASGLTYSITAYGDTFYRLRPFEMKTLAANADSVMIMAYDFHKAKGNPGPNFPLRGKEVYGYDMTQMIEDFLEFVPAEKLTVIFGLFGYDWIVDEKGNATERGEALSYLEIQKKFLGSCEFKDCSVHRKNDSTETQITYTDVSGRKHVVWFEDPESVKKKEQFLKENGIHSFSFWAYSYF